MDISSDEENMVGTNGLAQNGPLQMEMVLKALHHVQAFSGCNWKQIKIHFIYVIYVLTPAKYIELWYMHMCNCMHYI